MEISTCDKGQRCVCLVSLWCLWCPCLAGSSWWPRATVSARGVAARARGRCVAGPCRAGFSLWRYILLFALHLLLAPLLSYNGSFSLVRAICSATGAGLPGRDAAGYAVAFSACGKGQRWGQVAEWKCRPCNRLTCCIAATSARGKGQQCE